MSEETISRFSPILRKPHPDLLSIKQSIVGNCPLCGGAGHVEQLQCSCMDEMMAICGLDKAGMLPEYWLYQMKDAPISNDLKMYLINAVDQYAANRRNWRLLNLHIFGPYRVGKTTVVASLMKEFIKRQSMTSCGYVTARELLVSGRSQDRGEIDLKYLAELDLLVIEELGKESSADFHREPFIGFLDVLLRHRRGVRATILVSNFVPEKLAERYGSDIGLRLENDFTKIDFTGLPVLGVTSGSQVV